MTMDWLKARYDKLVVDSVEPEVYGQLMPEYVNEKILALDTSDRFKERIIDVVAHSFAFKKKLGFTEVWLFGSVARGEETYDSDIDIMLVTEENVVREQRILLDLEGILEENYSDVFIRSRRVLSNMDESFNRLVNRDKIILYKENKDGVYVTGRSEEFTKHI